MDEKGKSRASITTAVVCLGDGEDELVRLGKGVDELGKSRASITTAVKDDIE